MDVIFLSVSMPQSSWQRRKNVGADQAPRCACVLARGSLSLPHQEMCDFFSVSAHFFSNLAKISCWWRCSLCHNKCKIFSISICEGRKPSFEHQIECFLRPLDKRWQILDQDICYITFKRTNHICSSIRLATWLATVHYVIH